MKCSPVSSLHTCHFGRQSADMMRNRALSFEVVAPPNQLPTASLYDNINSQEYLGLSKSIINTEEINNKGSKAGKFSAGCASAVLALTALSFLPIIRKH